MFDLPDDHRTEAPTAADGDADPVADTATVYGQVGVGELVESSGQMLCIENLARLEYVRMVAELAGREVWKADGQTSMVAWLGFAHRLRRRTAHEVVTVAQVIGELPLVAETFGNGGLSWDQLVPICEIATAASDGFWAADGPGTSAEDLATMAKTKRVSDEQAKGVHERRSVSFRRCPTGGTAMPTFLADDVADAVKVALDRIFETEIGPDPATGEYPTVAQQRADALALLAGHRLAGDLALDRATVVVHGDIGLLTGEADGRACLADQTPIAAATFQRLACDGRIEWAVDGPDGTTLGIGRASREWPAWLARQIRLRDGDRCRFPGCNRPIHQIHHQKEWVAHKGETSDVNGVGACYTHHHLVHEGGWKVTGNPNGELTFTSPDGRRLTSHPRRLSPKVKAQLRDILPDRDP